MTRNSTREDSSATQARVQLLKHPMLQGLTRKLVEDWDKNYDNYELQVKSFGRSARPVQKHLCIDSDVKDLMAMELGKIASEIDDEEMQELLNKYRTKEIVGVRLDAKTVFRGLKMRKANRVDEIDEIITGYKLEIVKRQNCYGIAQKLLDEGEREFRKLCFPSIINGIYPTSEDKATSNNTS